MHIIVLAIAISGQRGGIEKSTLDLCKGLHQRQHKISLIYQQEGDQRSDYEAFCSYLYNIKAYKIGASDPIGYGAEFLHLCKHFSGAEDIVIYSSEYHTLMFGSLLAKTLNAPLIFHLRLPLSDYRQTKSPSLLSRLKKRLTLASVSRYIAVSQAIKQDCIATLGVQPAKIDVVFNGIDPEKFGSQEHRASSRLAWGLSPDETIITYIGRLDKDKGIETLLKAYAIFQATHPASRLLIAGKTVLQGEAYQHSLVQLAEDLLIQDQVQFLGHVQEPSSLYQSSDLTVLPSLWPEPFGRTVIESLAADTPVIASRTGGIPEILSGILPDLAMSRA
jgi:glycosyltransferase involved in cell wall biosynthesis